MNAMTPDILQHTDDLQMNAVINMYTYIYFYLSIYIYTAFICKYIYI